MFRKLLLSLLAGLFLSTISAYSATITLGWNANAATDDVIIYRVFVGTAAGNYSSHFDVGTALTTPMPGLVPGTTYHFALKAVNSHGIESIYSPELVYTVPLPTPTPSPTPSPTPTPTPLPTPHAPQGLRVIPKGAATAK